jgi:hypothetical protein
MRTSAVDDELTLSLGYSAIRVAVISSFKKMPETLPMPDRRDSVADFQLSATQRFSFFDAFAEDEENSVIV